MYVEAMSTIIIKMKGGENVYLTNRQSQILYLLLRQSMSIKDLLQHILVSEKTLRRELSELEYFLQEYNSQLIYDKLIWIQSVETSNWWFSQIPSLLSYRIEDCIKLYLYVQTDNCTFQDLGEQFHYTKSSIERILYSSDFEDFPLIKKRNVGMIYDGNVYDRIEGFTHLISSLGSYMNMHHTIKTVLDHAHIPCLLQRLEWLFEGMKRYLDVSNHQLLDQRILQFYCLLIAFDVVPQSKQTLSDHRLIQDMLGAMPELVIKDQLLFEQFIFDKIFQTSTSQSQARALMEQMMEAIEIELQSIIIKTPEIEIQLEKHIEEALKRFQNYSVHVEESHRFIQDFRSNYPLAYEAGSIAIEILQPFSSTLLPDVETIYFGMYFHLLMEQGQTALDTAYHLAIICEHGFGISHFIQANLIRRFESFRVRKIASVFELTQHPERFSTYDFILCTMGNVLVDPILEEKLITISPLLTKKDIQVIEQTIERSKNNAFLKRLKAHTLLITDQYFMDPSSLIAWASELLKQRGYVSTNYGKTVLERERKIPTAFDFVAIPHGDFHEVIESSCVVVCLKSPMIWSGQFVEMVVMLAVNDEDLTTQKEAIAQLYQQLADDMAYKKIKAIWGTEDIIHYLMGGN